MEQRCFLLFWVHRDPGRYFKVGECLYLGNGRREAKGIRPFLAIKRISAKQRQERSSGLLDRALKWLEGLFAQMLVVSKIPDKRMSVSDVIQFPFLLVFVRKERFSCRSDMCFIDLQISPKALWANLFSSLLLFDSSAPNEEFARSGKNGVSDPREGIYFAN